MKQGDRVGAILSAKDGVVKLLGYGTYEGKEVPPEEVAVGFILGTPNPKIKLDSGSVVYGCECWWGSESAIREILERYHSVEEVDIEDVRSELRPTRGDS